jgi:transposase
MNSEALPVQTDTLGVDVGDRYSHYCRLDARGAVLERGRVATTPCALKKLAAGRPMRVAVEAGQHSPWIAPLFERAGHEVLVANPRRLRVIYLNDSKTDRVDAESLARVARLDPHLLAPIHHRGTRAHADLASLRARQTLVRARTQLINHVRSAAKTFGARLPTCSAPAFHRRVAQHLPVELQGSLEPLLRALALLTEEIRQWDGRCARLAREGYPETERLRQVTGVGPLTALTYVLTLEDPRRFPRSRAVGSYLGLRPRQRSSGNSAPQLRITKSGDSDLRRLLVACAHYILGPFGPDSDLRRWGLAIAERGGKTGRKRAVVAVARKLSILLHRLWASGEQYQPFRQPGGTAPVLASA